MATNLFADVLPAIESDPSPTPAPTPAPATGRFGRFSDILPADQNSPATPAPPATPGKFGQFADILPESITPATDKAVASIPTVVPDVAPTGRQIVHNQDGSVSTERTATVGFDGRFYNVPTLFNGQSVSPAEALTRVQQAGMKDPETGQDLPGFTSVAEAVTAAKARSDAIGNAISLQQRQQLSPEEMSRTGSVYAGPDPHDPMPKMGDAPPALTPEYTPPYWLAKGIEAGAKEFGLQDNAAIKIYTGELKGVADMISGFTTPENLILLTSGGFLPKIAHKLIAGAFSAQAAYHAPEAWKAFNETDDVEQKARIAMGTIAGIGLPLLALRGEKPLPGKPKTDVVAGDAIRNVVDETIKEVVSPEGTLTTKEPLPTDTSDPLTRATASADETNVDSPTAASPGPSVGGAMLDPVKYPVMELPIAGLKLSKDVPNFKAGADPETGVVPGNELQGKYERLGTPPLVTWERLNGDREVITGRHKFHLGKQNGETSLPQQVVREADGFTAADAARLDAEINIRDGQGSVKDYANFFRSTRISPDEATQRSLLSRSAGRQGYAIGNDASDALFALYANGKLTDAEAASVAVAAPGDAHQQGVGIEFLKRGGDKSDVSNFLQAAETLPIEQGQQGDLFGGNDAALNAATKMTESARAIQDVFRRDVQVLAQARSKGHALRLTDPEAARYGIADKNNPSQIAGAYEKAKANSLDWQRWAKDPAKLAEVRARAGEPQGENQPSGQATPKENGALWYQGVGPEGATSWVTSNLEKAKIYANRRGAGGRINVFTPEQVGESAFADQEGNLLSPQEYAKTQSEDTVIQTLGREGKLPEPSQVLDSNGRPEAPKLRPNETQGDMLQGRKDQPFNLAGETTMDAGKLAADQAKAERDAFEAKKIQDQQQTEMPLTDATATPEETAPKLKLKLNKKTEGGFIDPPTLREVTDFGRRLYEKGKDYIRWSGEMVGHLGEKIKPHLKTIWDSLTGKNILPHARESGAVGGVGLRKTKGFLGTGMREMSEMDKATTEHSAKLQQSTQESRMAEKVFSHVDVGTTGKPKLKKISEARRNAIAIYRDAGGDTALLRQQLTKAKQKWFIKAATDALTLTPAEKALGARYGSIHDTVEQRLNSHGVRTAHRDNYVTHVWDIKKGADVPGGGSRKLQTEFRHSKARTLETFFDGDQANMVPKTLDISKLAPAYLNEANKVIADRQFVRDVVKGKGTDTAPLAIRGGNTKQVENPTRFAVVQSKGGRALRVFDTAKEAQNFAKSYRGLDGMKGDAIVEPRESKAVLVTPHTKDAATNAAGEPVDTSTYKMMPDQPALSDWHFKGNDTAGNPIFLKSDLYLHPEAYKRLNSVLGTAGRVKGYDTLSHTIKREMFSFLAPFHQVQEATHAIGHTVNPFFGLKKVDFSDAAVKDAAKHGLMMEAERPGYNAYLEGVGTDTSLLSRGLRKTKIGAPIANIADAYQGYLFHSYIPRLKYTTYEHIRGRNMKRFAEEMKAGTVTESDVKLLSSIQTNSAFGHLNLALMDRSPNHQAWLSRMLLAPDFLEARGQFTAQAISGIWNKAGREQFRAVATLAAIQAGAAYVVAQVFGDKDSWSIKDPFSVKIGDRKYTVRSVPEDLFRLVSDVKDFTTGAKQGIEFASARVNPLVQTFVQYLYGRNYRGEKTTALQTTEELFGKVIPITLRQLPGLRDLTETSANHPVSPMEQLAGSFGLKISRASPIADAYSLANRWKRKNGLPADIGTYPVSKYQQLRYALEDSDFKKAHDEYAKLVSLSGQQGLLPARAVHQVNTGFKESIEHPFVDHKHKKAFEASLSHDDRQVFDLAVQRRKNILLRFERLKVARIHGGTSF